MVRLILASQSPARTKLLAEAGIRHSILVSDVDEDAVQASYGVTDPHDTALLLARAKAEAVAALPEAEGALVLGCDSVFEFDGEGQKKRSFESTRPHQALPPHLPIQHVNLQEGSDP